MGNNLFFRRKLNYNLAPLGVTMNKVLIDLIDAIDNALKDPSLPSLLVTQLQETRITIINTQKLNDEEEAFKWLEHLQSLTRNIT